MMIEEMFAAVVLKCEPVKVRGGSIKRRAWLKLILDVQGYLITQGYDHRYYADLLNGVKQLPGSRLNTV